MELVYYKLFNLAKNPFKAIQNSFKSNRCEQVSVIKSSVAKKHIPYKIYVMCTEKTCFSHKNAYKMAENGFATQILSLKGLVLTN